MNYLNPQLKDALAAEYVLGTLHGGARRRFQKLMLQYPSLREATWLWEQQLHGLNERLIPIEPDAKVWSSIKDQLMFDSIQNVEVVNTKTNTTTKKTLTNKTLTNKTENKARGQNVVKINTPFNRAWKSVTALATAASILMAVALFDKQNSDVALPQQVAVMQTEQAETLWLIEVSDNSIDVLATRKLTPEPNNDFELWIVAKGIENPISLGLLPKSGKLSLPKHADFDSMDIVALAVSIEPLNGSPNGLPTKVLYTAALATL